MNAKKIFIWAFRLILLTVLYIPIWILGTVAIGDLIPDTTSEPGLVDEVTGMLILAVINTVLIISLIVTSLWNGWRLAFFLALAYYGSFTFLTQIETWYFLSDISISPKLLSRLFIMGLSIPIIFIPLAILICKRWKKSNVTSRPSNFDLPLKQLLLKVGIIAVIYVMIYWLAGYFIAWQNPELRAFYGSPGEIEPFFSHTVNTFSNTPGLILLQLFRGILFAVLATPIIIGSKVKPWITALLVGFLFAIPHLVHIMPNALMPIASVRLSHMIETATSSFIFGLIVVWLLYPRTNNEAGKGSMLKGQTLDGDQ